MRSGQAKVYPERMGSLYSQLDHGIRVIDTDFGRPHFAASYLVVEKGRAAFVDTGPNRAVPRLLAALEQNGLERDAVDWVIATHVHLDGLSVTLDDRTDDLAVPANEAFGR